MLTVGIMDLLLRRLTLLYWFDYFSYPSFSVDVRNIWFVVKHIINTLSILIVLVEVEHDHGENVLYTFAEIT